MGIEELYDLYTERQLICTDTRKIEQGSIFFALKGDSFNGNEYAEKALDDGCLWAIVDEDINPGNNRLILVEDVLHTLQRLAHYHRKQLSIPFLAITGSNGKTTTKELLLEALSTKFTTFATKGNLNNHIGVPLSLLSITPQFEFAIIEMGANHVDEIRFLCDIAEPNFGLITNIGEAHLEGFGGLDGVKKGKGELFEFLRKTNGLVFINSSVDHIVELAHDLNTVNYSTEEDPFQLKISQSTPTITFSWRHKEQIFEAATHLTGSYNLDNFSAAIAISLHFNAEPASVNKALSNYVPSNHRSQIIERNGRRLILDSYNANPSSMEVALQNLASMDAEKKFFVLGDMLELGAQSKFKHEGIADMALNLGIKGILVGAEFGQITDNNLAHYKDADAAGKALKQFDLSGATILIKGSRGIGLEKLLDYL